MTTFKILNNRFCTLLMALLATLMISACTTSSEESSESINSSNTTEIPVTNEDPITQDPTATTAMYSYNADLSNALPLEGAVLAQTTVYMFFVNTTEYSRMIFYCCKGISGNSTGEAHNSSVSDSSSPFVYVVNLSQYTTSGTRELYVDGARTDGNGYDNYSVNFSINIGTKSIPTTGADINLSWVAPFEREDNNAISPSEIAGYNIYYGTSQGNYTETIYINNGSVDDHTLKNLTTGTYYFVITTRDTGGRESKYSSVITKTI